MQAGDCYPVCCPFCESCCIILYLSLARLTIEFTSVTQESVSELLRIAVADLELAVSVGYLLLTC